jgi:hypothetical protein
MNPTRNVSIRSLCFPDPSLPAVPRRDSAPPRDPRRADPGPPEARVSLRARDSDTTSLYHTILRCGLELKR